MEELMNELRIYSSKIFSGKIEPETIIINDVLCKLSVDYELLKNKSRKLEAVIARHIISYKLLKLNYTHKRIGNILGIDHTSVIYAKHRIETATPKNDKKLYNALIITDTI